MPDAAILRFDPPDQSPPPEGTWVTRSGYPMPVADMSDQHLANALAMLHRKFRDGFALSGHYATLATEARRRGLIVLAGRPDDGESCFGCEACLASRTSHKAHDGWLPGLRSSLRRLLGAG